MPVGEQYEACRKILSRQVNKDDPTESITLPSPINWCLIMMVKWRSLEIFGMCQIILGFRCQILWDRLQRIRWDSDSLMIGDVGNCQAVFHWQHTRGSKDFGELMTQFLGVLLKAMAEWTVSVRRGEDLKEKTITKAIKAMEIQSPS